MARPDGERNQIAGERLKWARDACDLTQEELSEHQGWLDMGLAKTVRSLSRYETEGVPKRELPKVADFFGLTKVELTGPEMDENTCGELVLLRHSQATLIAKIRDVRKILCLLAARDAAGAVRLLTYYSPDWKADLFINVSLPENPNEDMPTLIKLLAARLDVSPESIFYSFDCQDDSMASICIKSTGDKHKARIAGKRARYTFRYCPIRVNDPPSHLMQQTFVCRDIKYSWRTLSDLKSSPRESELNHDAFRFISAKWDATLELFPEILAEPIG